MLNVSRITMSSNFPGTKPNQTKQNNWKQKGLLSNSFWSQNHLDIKAEDSTRKTISQYLINIIRSRKILTEWVHSMDPTPYWAIERITKWQIHTVEHYSKLKVKALRTHAQANRRTLSYGSELMPLPAGVLCPVVSILDHCIRPRT